MNKLNEKWHLANKMPKNPKLEERIKWHKAHAIYCKCREMPESIKKYL